MSKSFSNNKNQSLIIDKFEKSDEQILTPTSNDGDKNKEEKEIEEKKSKSGKNKHYLLLIK